MTMDDKARELLEKALQHLKTPYWEQGRELKKELEAYLNPQPEWMPERGDLVLVSDHEKEEWFAGTFTRHQPASTHPWVTNNYTAWMYCKPHPLQLERDRYREALEEVRIESSIRPGTVAATKTVMMPRSLTAENGAKKALIGEFYIDVDTTCSACYFGIPEETCEVCGGEVHYTIHAPVDWPTIKAIYAKAVDLLGE